MSQSARPLEPRHTSKEFDRWWESHGQVIAVQAALDPATARILAWEAWRKGRELLYEATAAQRLQPVAK